MESSKRAQTQTKGRKEGCGRRDTKERRSRRRRESANKGSIRFYQRQSGHSMCLIFLSCSGLLGAVNTTVSAGLDFFVLHFSHSVFTFSFLNPSFFLHFTFLLISSSSYSLHSLRSLSSFTPSRSFCMTHWLLSSAPWSLSTPLHSQLSTLHSPPLTRWSGSTSHSLSSQKQCLVHIHPHSTTSPLPLLHAVYNHTPPLIHNRMLTIQFQLRLMSLSLVMTFLQRKNIENVVVWKKKKKYNSATTYIHTYYPLSTCSNLLFHPESAIRCPVLQNWTNLQDHATSPLSTRYSALSRTFPGERSVDVLPCCFCYPITYSISLINWLFTGNGPAGILISLLLSGYEPYYHADGACPHPDPILHRMLTPSSLQGCKPRSMLKQVNIPWSFSIALSFNWLSGLSFSRSMPYVLVHFKPLFTSTNRWKEHLCVEILKDSVCHA